MVYCTASKTALVHVKSVFAWRVFRDGVKIASLTTGEDRSACIKNAEDNVQLDPAINDAYFDLVFISEKADGCRRLRAFMTQEGTGAAA